MAMIGNSVLAERLHTAVLKVRPSAWHTMEPAPKEGNPPFRRLDVTNAIEEGHILVPELVAEIERVLSHHMEQKYKVLNVDPDRDASFPLMAVELDKPQAPHVDGIHPPGYLSVTYHVTPGWMTWVGGQHEFREQFQQYVDDNIDEDTVITKYKLWLQQERRAYARARWLMSKKQWVWVPSGTFSWWEAGTVVHAGVSNLPDLDSRRIVAYMIAVPEDKVEEAMNPATNGSSEYAIGLSRWPEKGDLSWRKDQVPGKSAGSDTSANTQKQKPAGIPKQSPRGTLLNTQ